MAGIYPDAQGDPLEPLTARMMENFPGFAASAGFASLRGSNTILRGGFMDDARRASKAEKYRIFQGNKLSAVNERQFVGGGRRFSPFAKRAARKAKAAESQFLFKSSRVNFATARPRALTRFHSLSVFGKNGGYTPFGGSGFVGKSKPVRSAFEKIGIKAADGESVLGPGLLSFISAGRKADMLEKRALAGSSRAAKRLAKAQTQIKRLALMNNPSLAQGYAATAGKTFEFGRILPKSANAGIVAAPYSELSFKGTGQYSANSFVGKSLASGGGQVGVSGNLMASSMAGEGSKYLAGYVRGAMGFGNVAGLEGKALTGAKVAKVHMAEALRSTGIVSKGSGMKLATEALADKNLFKTLGSKNVMKVLGTKSGAKALGARALGSVLPGVNVLMAASLVYDLGKMAGEVVKSGINLAKDAVVSMKGDIAKPMFGMGYRDTEAAATSRSRGVMAIQNSQLNARSALGNEGAMMAAHFG